jgi:ribulose 1,5-bisphosphate carboxylase large subunit-like protein
MKMTRNTQEKLQNVLKAQGYKIRYEKGNFVGGYCWVKDQKIIIINKFHPLEAKISTLMEIIRDIEIEEDELTEDLKKIAEKVKADSPEESTPKD